jgi:hypothetical protein
MVQAQVVAVVEKVVLVLKVALQAQLLAVQELTGSPLVQLMLAVAVVVLMVVVTQDLVLTAVVMVVEAVLEALAQEAVEVVAVAVAKVVVAVVVAQVLLSSDIGFHNGSFCKTRHKQYSS